MNALKKPAKWKSSDLLTDSIIPTEKDPLASVADSHKYSKLMPKTENRQNQELNTCQYLSMLASSGEKRKKEYIEVASSSALK